MSFYQDPPQNPNLYDVDRPLRAELDRRLPPDLRALLEPRLAAMGEATASVLPPLARQAEAEPPVHVPWDAWGRRVDRIKTSGAWDELKRFSAEQGVVALGYDAAYGPWRRVAQAAVLHLYSASSAIFSCPLAMTDAAARVLMDLAEPALRDRLVPRLLSTDPAIFITSGQWMTERTGGSDVGGTETVARPLGVVGGLDQYALFGTKWFTSATTSEMALALGRVDDGVEPPMPGSRGLTLFCVDVSREAEGGLRGIRVNRLKDKLGTRALPTAELELTGALGARVGPVGRGVASISGMLNITRYYNSVAATSGMARAVALAMDYATRRGAHGRRLLDHPLHRETLADLAAETAAATALVMELAALLGRAEAGEATDAEQRRLRALVPLTKLTTGKQAVAVASEALECVGGAGYVEDTGLPALLRDAQVLPIWEGTTNVLSLDLLRAEGKDGALSALLADLSQRAGRLPGLEPAGAALGRVRKAVAHLTAQGDREGMERIARRVALTTGLCAEAVFLGETAAEGDAASRERLDRFLALRFSGPAGAL